MKCNLMNANVELNVEMIIIKLLIGNNINIINRNSWLEFCPHWLTVSLLSLDSLNDEKWNFYALLMKLDKHDYQTWFIHFSVSPLSFDISKLIIMIIIIIDNSSGMK